MHMYTYIMSAHVHTYTYIHSRTQNVHMNARRSRLKRWCATTARAAQLHTKKLCPSPCPHHDSAPSRPHPLICTGAEQIHPVQCPRQLPALPWPPETRSFSCHFGGVFSKKRCFSTEEFTPKRVVLVQKNSLASCQRCRHSVEPRALTCPFKQSDLIAWSLLIGHPTHKCL